MECVRQTEFVAAPRALYAAIASRARAERVLLSGIAIFLENSMADRAGGGAEVLLATQGLRAGQLPSRTYCRPDRAPGGFNERGAGNPVVRATTKGDPRGGGAPVLTPGTQKAA